MKAKTVTDFKRELTPEKSLDVGIFSDLSKIPNLSLPVRYNKGMIIDNDGYVILEDARRMHRRLDYIEMESLLEFIVKMINLAYES